MAGDILTVWVFVSRRGSFPSGIFKDKKSATLWIEKYDLTGVLTCYPLGEGVYDWAIENNYFKVKKEHQKKAEFIGKFSSAAQEHYHFKEGKLDA